ncbi:MAG: DUF1456 family protein [Granulosicoccus sp.]
MDNNDLIGRIRYATRLDDAECQRLLQLGALSVDQDTVAAWRLKPDEAEFRACPDKAINALLTGLVLDRRGPPDASRGSSQKQPTSVDNNQVLKQLRIALSLRTESVQALLIAGGGELSKSEINALFRRPEARNYRVCGDQVLRWFLTGLARQRSSS